MYRNASGSNPAAASSAAQLRDAFSGMSAKERHDMMMRQYMHLYGGDAQVKAAGGWDKMAAARAASQVQASDMDLLRQGHRFIREPEDDLQGGLAAKFARKYYDRLFREYCIADLSRYKESKVGMRWRTQQEVVSGKGHLMCGCKGCSSQQDLASYEVNFVYHEDGKNKQALVKLRLCPECAYKLNYKKQKQFRKVQAKSLKQALQEAQKNKDRKRSRDGSREGHTGRGSDNDSEVEPGASRRQRRDGDQEYSHDPHGTHRDQAPQRDAAQQLDSAAQQPSRPHARQSEPGQSNDAIAVNGSQSRPGLGQSEALGQLPKDNRVWERAPVQDASAEEELDAYLESMFM